MAAKPGVAKKWLKDPPHEGEDWLYEGYTMKVTFKNSIISLSLACMAAIPCTTETGIATTAALTASSYLGHRGYQTISRSTRLKNEKQRIAAIKNDPNHPLNAVYNRYNDPKDPKTKKIVLFSPGIHSDRTKGHRYKELGFIPPYLDVHTFDYSNSKLLPKDQQVPSSIGQEADAERLAEEYFKLVEQGYRVIIYGASRGAATALMFMAFYQPINVDMAILEAPFADVEDVITACLNRAYLGFVPGLSTFFNLVFGYYEHKNYSTGGPTPKDIMADISHTIPLMFGCSLEDTFVPPNSTLKLPKLAQEGGHPYCWPVVLKYGYHAHLVSDKKRDKAMLKDLQQAIKTGDINRATAIRNKQTQILHSRKAYKTAVYTFIENPYAYPYHDPGSVAAYESKFSAGTSGSHSTSSTPVFQHQQVAV